MNYLLARIRDRKNGMRCLLSNQKTYDAPYISFLCSSQDDGLIYFQRVTETQLLQKKRVVFGDIVKYEESSKEIIINSTPDAIYSATNDKLFFQKLSSITAIFHGIDKSYHEATEEETRAFLESDFIVKGALYNRSCVKNQIASELPLLKKL